jgi:hypothetical protein
MSQESEDYFVPYLLICIGARQPSYVVTADDVDTLLAIEVQPLDDRKRKVLISSDYRYARMLYFLTKILGRFWG